MWICGIVMENGIEVDVEADEGDNDVVWEYLNENLGKKNKIYSEAEDTSMRFSFKGITITVLDFTKAIGLNGGY